MERRPKSRIIDMKTIEIIFIASLAFIATPYFLYPMILMLTVKLKDRKEYEVNGRTIMPISIIIAAYNEEKNIGRRINNCLSLAYPSELLEIIIASDGSTDGTVAVASTYNERTVRVFASEQHRGRAQVHNDTVGVARGEILVFTDAETIFSEDFLMEITAPFSNKEVGCVVGNLSYLQSSREGTSISQSEALYYNKFESRLKAWESRLGILSNGTGACMAIRKGLFLPLKADEDVDTATPIDIILSGYKVVMAEDAVAYDIPPNSVRAELRYRMRGVSHTLCCISRRLGRRSLRHPGLILSVVSHRVLRYLSPYFMLLAVGLNIPLLWRGAFYQTTFALQVLFYSTMMVGWIGEMFKKRIPIASTVFSFCMASLGMMMGVMLFILGRRYEAYDRLE